MRLIPRENIENIIKNGEVSIGLILDNNIFFQSERVENAMPFCKKNLLVELKEKLDNTKVSM